MATASLRRRVFSNSHLEVEGWYQHNQTTNNQNATALPGLEGTQYGMCHYCSPSGLTNAPLAEDGTQINLNHSLPVRYSVHTLHSAPVSRRGKKRRQHYRIRVPKPDALYHLSPVAPTLLLHPLITAVGPRLQTRTSEFVPALPATWT